MVFHNEDGNPARANIKQALGRPHKGVKASANSDVMYFFTSAQDGDPLQDDVRLCLGDDLKKAQDHNEDAHDHIDRSSASSAYSIFSESLKTQSCFEFFLLLLSDLKKGGWTDSPQELSIPGISSKRPLSKGTIPGMRPTQDLTVIQTMADHSQKWHNEATSRKNRSSSSNDGLAALVDKLDNLGRDIKKLKESVHAIQVGCQICEGPHLDKDCPLNEKVKLVEESRVTTLAKEAVTKIDKKEDCKFTSDGTPLYTPFYYSIEEIEYFSANSGFSDNDESKNVTSIPSEDLKQTSPKQTTTHYIEPYVPPIPFPRRLEQHAEEALIHKTMESQKKIKSNRPFLMEIRQSDEYPKFMKDMVANKPLTMENEDVRINHRCSALLLNQLPPKEKDPGSFILPCSIERMPVILGRPLLTTAHAKVDVFKRSISLEVGNEKVIFKMKSELPNIRNESVLMIQSNMITEEDELMNIESDLFTYITNTCESCQILAVDTDLFTYKVVTQETYNEITHKCCLTAQEAIGENTKPFLGKTHWCAPIYRQNNGFQEVWASCNPSNQECDGGSLRNNEIRCYWESKNDNDRTNIEWNDLSLNDWLKIKYGEVDETMKKKILTEHWRKRFRADYDDSNDFYDFDQCGDGRNNEIRERIIHNLHEEWFKGTSDDEDDIEGIIDYLEPTSYDGFIDLDEEEYNKRRCRLLGMTYIKSLPIIIKQVKITRYSLGLGEVYTKLEVLNMEELPQTRNNVATIRNNIMDEFFENYEDEMT
ncbi:hypothetical protein Tco_0813010 [Tanacetum coccineum]